MKPLIRCVVTAATLAGILIAAAPAHAIIDGRDADQTYPGLVSMSIIKPGVGTATCGGGLIKPGVVVTAAHCVSDPIVAPAPAAVPAEGITVHVGSADRTRGVVGVGKTVLLYPGWAWGLPGAPVADLALVYLTSPIYGVPLLPISWTPAVPGDEVREIGWGLTAFPPVRPVVLPTILQQRDTPVFPAEGCVAGFIGVGDLCTGPAACLGDSGNPALRWSGARWVAVGLASREATTDGSCGLSVYTDLSYYRLWIWFETSLPFVDHTTRSTYQPRAGIAPAIPPIPWLPDLR